MTVQPINPAPKGLEGIAPSYQAYALGWEVRDYRGTKIVSHGGAVFGFVTTVVMIPEKNVGFAITLNSEDSDVRLGLMYELLDHYIAAPKQDWRARFSRFLDQRLAAGKAAVEQKLTAPAAVGPSLPLDRYAGTYTDPWYGDIVVSRDGEGLAIDFKTTPNMKGRLKHHQYDTFVAELTDTNLERPYVTFGLGAEGNVERVTMEAVSPIADFSFNYHDLLFTPAAAKK